jgi:hypothetical protein
MKMHPKVITLFSSLCLTEHYNAAPDRHNFEKDVEEFQKVFVMY